MEIDWHADRANLDKLCLLDRDPADREIDQVAVRAHRQGRVREQMALLGIDACLLLDSTNVRYATGSRNMEVFSRRNPCRYVFLPVSGPVVLFEFMGCEHLSQGLETIDEIRPAITASFVSAGPHITERERIWARETGSLIREHCGPNACVGVERVNAGAAMALSAEGFRVVDAQYPVELARCIKSDEELKCVRSSMRATERAVQVLYDCIEPGLTEEQLWSILHQGVIAQGGDYIETRLLNAGERTNPWFQETSDKVIGPNELIALDTDVVGCFGYYADFSRTFHAGPDKPTAKQKEMYKTSLEQITHNMNIVYPGMSFKEYAEKAWDIPEKYQANRYYLSAHGCGMTGEYPYLYHRMEYEHAGYDGVIEPHMVICFESFIGEEGHGEGVKLEQQCLITEHGVEVMSQFPFEEALMDESIHAAPDLRVVSGDADADTDAGDDTPRSDEKPARGLAREALSGTSPSAARQPIAPARTDTESGPTQANPRTGREKAVFACGPARIGDTVQSPAAANRSTPCSAVPPTVGEVVDRPADESTQVDADVEVTLLGDAEIDERARRAAGTGVQSVIVPPGHVRPVLQGLGDCDVLVGTVIGALHGDISTSARALEARRAVRAGVRGVDIVLDVESLCTGDHKAAFDDLCRVINPAREARLRTAVVIDCGRLDEAGLVAAAKIAARVRPDCIALGGNGTTARQLMLVREAVGKRVRIRAELGAGDDAPTLLAAGADCLSITGAADEHTRWSAR